MALDNYSILGYYLPSEILCQILSKFLTVDDISHLDTAISNRNKRPLFLDCVGSEACIWLGDKGRMFTSVGLSWLNRRHIKVRCLKCGSVTDDMTLKIAGSGIHLQWLKIEDVNDVNMSKIVEDCSEIKDLDISECDSLTNIIATEIAHYCPNLKSLKTPYFGLNTGIVRIAEGCPKLKVFDLSRCHNLTNTCVIKIVECCPELEDLNISISQRITDVSVIKIAEGCPQLKRLRLGHCYKISDVSVIKLAEGCPNLEELWIRRCPNVTDNQCY